MPGSRSWHTDNQLSRRFGGEGSFIVVAVSGHHVQAVVVEERFDLLREVHSQVQICGSLHCLSVLPFETIVPPDVVDLGCGVVDVVLFDDYGAIAVGVLVRILLYVELKKRLSCQRLLDLLRLPEADSIGFGRQ